MTKLVYFNLTLTKFSLLIIEFIKLFTSNCKIYIFYTNSPKAKPYQQTTMQRFKLTLK